MSRRSATAGLILALWVAGLGILVHREYFQPNLERLAEAGLRVTPGGIFYGVLQGDKQVGFASSTIDTAKTSITVDDYMVADLPVGDHSRRATSRTLVVLSRAMRVRSFKITIDSTPSPIEVTGRLMGDSLLLLTVASGNATPDTQRIALTSPLLLPTLVPLAVALGEKPKVGKHYVLPIFDPATMTPKDVGVNVTAESLFVVNDSAVFDSAAMRWTGVLPDTIHAWQLATEAAGSTSPFAGWIDEQGRVVQSNELGLHLRRLPYEVAFENWRIAAAGGVAKTTSDRNLFEITAIAAGKRWGREVRELRVRLSGADLRGFALTSPRQHLRGDTLDISPEGASALRAIYTLPLGGRHLQPQQTSPDSPAGSHDAEIKALAARLSGSESNPFAVAERLNRWVHDSVARRVALGTPSATEVLRTRGGDCIEHTRLYIALARAAGIPARPVAGLAYVDGKFYYHAWPEVFLNGWVAVDPTFGQFPADAAHVRFTIGGLGRQAELLRLMGNLKLDVVP